MRKLKMRKKTLSETFTANVTDVRKACRCRQVMASIQCRTIKRGRVTERDTKSVTTTSAE